jgi:predicted metal-dependent hydrolase
VKIQSSRTRWGSCSASNSINLSLFLMALSSRLIDYVIKHELCHTVHHDHSDKFWRLMDDVTDGKAKALRRELKANKMVLG